MTVLFMGCLAGCGGHADVTGSILYQTTDIPIPGQPYEATCADFNSDGWDDIAVTVKYSGVYVFFNNGKNFDEYRQFTGPFQHGISIKTGDVTGDGENDLINLFENGVQFFIGNGKGDFIVSEKSLDGPLMSRYIEVAHLNDDRLLDLIAVGARDSRVFVYINEGNLNFRVLTIDLKPADVPTAPEFRHVSADDLDGDGFNDILVADSRNRIIWVLWNDTNGAFVPATLHTATARVSSAVPYALCGDSSPPSILFSEEVQEGGIGFLENRGERLFVPQQTIHSYPMPTYLKVADMDADGTRDIVISHLTSDEPRKGRISVLYGPDFEKQYAATLRGISIYLCVCDWNRDGLPDIFAPSLSSDSITYIPSNISAYPTSLSTFP